MAIGDSSWELVIRHTFVEMVQTENKQARAKSEGGKPLPILPTVADFTTQSPQSVYNACIRVSSREPPVQRESVSSHESATVQKQASATEPPPSQTSPTKQSRFGWCARLCGAVGPKPLEDKGTSFSEMHNTSVRGVPTSSTTQWRVVISDAERGLQAGDSFRVSAERMDNNGVVHLCHADGSGWVASRKPGGEILCERVKHRKRGSREQLQLAVVDRPKTQSISWSDVTEEELQVESPIQEHRTTVVMTEIPSDCSRDGLIARLDDAGLAGQYDFVYLPVSFERLSTHGYGIVNFVSSEAAQKLIKEMPGSANWSDQRQGLREHVANFQDSSLMHDGVPDQFKPILFKDGKRVPFPAPTRQTRMPRELKRAICRMKSGELAGDSNILTVASERRTPTSEGRTPTSEGRTPTSEGRTPTSEGRTPTSEGRTPTSEGRTPTSEGRTPSDEGRTPTSEGRTPSDEGRTPSSEGRTPTSEGRTNTSRKPTSEGRKPTAQDQPHSPCSTDSPKCDRSDQFAANFRRIRSRRVRRTDSSSPGSHKPKQNKNASQGA